MNYELMALPDLSRIGSILMMLLFISVLIIAHEMGHFFVARRCGVKVERFGFGLPFGPTLWSKKIGEVEYCIHAALFGGYVAFADDDPDHPLPKDAPERFENKPLLQRFAVMVAGVTVNAVLGWSILFFVFMTWGYPGGEVEKRVLIGGFTGPQAPAVLGGLQKNDEIKRIADVPVQGKDFVAMAGQVKTTMKRYALKPVSLEVLRHNRPVRVQVTPGRDGKIGIELGAVPVYEKMSGPLEGAAKTSSFLGNVIVKQFEAFGRLFTGKMALKELAGPIGIVDAGSKMIQKNGIQTGLMLTAIISTILAVMNLLPIPALDGGHILFLLLEAVKGSPVRQSLREGFTQVGFFGLLALILFILGNDVYNTFLNPVK